MKWLHDMDILYAHRLPEKSHVISFYKKDVVAQIDNGALNNRIGCHHSCPVLYAVQWP